MITDEAAFGAWVKIVIAERDEMVAWQGYTLTDIPVLKPPSIIHTRDLPLLLYHLVEAGFEIHAENDQVIYAFNDEVKRKIIAEWQEQQGDKQKNDKNDTP